MTPTPPDLDLSGTWTINVDDGTIQNPQLQQVSAPNFDVPQLSGGPSLRVFVVGDLKLGDVIVYSHSGGDLGVAFLASGDVTLSGTVTVNSGTGSIHSASCQGKNGASSHAQANDACYLLAAGGGGGATAGSSGGLIVDGGGGTPILGGAASGSDDLQPLAGGCSGGGFNNTEGGTSLTEGSYGGGAIQITSRKSITVAGHLLADGGLGGDTEDQGCFDSTFGAGGGGGILLEAPTLTLAPMSSLSAAGGNGLGCNPATATCGVPGMGGTGTTGGNVNFTTALGGGVIYYPGTGGGGVGRIRINTSTGSFTSDNTAVKNAVVTTGMVKTR
jgi:hypothetical protein